ncbi:MAG: EAL domain-containing protein [Gammaproteobacteria bacterium]|nr:EAL domain-containing protein [Gammaproteobacteria bacterium]MBU1645847.1 EAL domain-containing protein [Gammaproteobacteria bacterium]MBU1971909.1 EAL domain-containing protein [Gammaproteobacteria bacterium]
MSDQPAYSRRLITSIALLIAFAVTVLLPALVWFQNYRKEVVEMELLASVFADQVTQQAATGDPEFWKSHAQPLADVLGARLDPTRADEARFIETAAGERVVIVGRMPSSLSLTRAASFKMAGDMSGRVVIVRSQRQLVEVTIFALLLGSTLGFGIYLALAHLPMRDIERAIDLLAEERERSRQMFAHARDGMLSYDDYLKITDANKAAELLFGRDRSTIVGQHLQTLFDVAGTRGQRDGNLWLESGKDFEVSARGSDGSLIPVEVSVGRIEDRKEVCRIAIVRNLTARRAVESDLNLFVNYDSLTRLPNRDYFRELLSEALFRAQRRGSSVGLLFLDLSRFKLVNDALGHAVGDKLLCATARRLQQTLAHAEWPGRGLSGLAKKEALVSRLGGDEFAIILEELTDPAGAEKVARQVIDAIREPFDIEGHEVSIGSSVGIAIFPEHADFVGKLIRAADLAMYQARTIGHNSFHVWSESLETGRQERLDLEARLRRGLAAEAFELHYQPILGLSADVVEGVEVLLRWQDGEDNLLLPPDFIDVLEDIGMIREVGAWVMRTACLQLRGWIDAGHSGLRLSVNLSQHQFNDPDLAQTTAAAIADSGIDPACLELALSENTLSQSAARSHATLQALRDIGVRIALDRFGTGLSCLASLKQLPLTTLKVDLFFVHDLVESDSSRAIAQTVIDLGRALDLQTIAVGVEREEQRQMLQAMGCDLYQGFLATPPMSARSCLAWIEQHGSHGQPKLSLVS